MIVNHNPQARQMGAESMAKNLAHQASAIWPQEAPLFDRYQLSGAIRILDLGCGTGEITRRLAARYESATLLGVDILEESLTIARRESASLGERVRYEKGDAFALALPDASVELVTCRHMSQAVPHFENVLAEITRVLAPGGWAHILSEDYGMLHIPNDNPDPDRFWSENVVIAYMRSIGCDGQIGRHTPPLLETAGYRDIRMNYVIVDTLRVPRHVFGGIMRAWKDGYVEPLAAASGRSESEIARDFDAMIHAIETPPNYAAWQVPIASGQKP
jgi:ubiquinone/menaquinone biosynthesis C-methylase UbiE